MKELTREHQIHPRDYQTECVNTLWDYFHNGGTGSPVLALPCSTGKSIIIPLFIQRALHAYPNSRFLMLTHVKELIEQNHKALLKVAPTSPVGIYSAGLGKKEPSAPIVYGSIQSVKNNVAALGYRDALFLDECQLLSPKENTMYQDVIEELRKVNPSMPVIGLSATPFRMEQGMLTDPTFDKEGVKKKAIFTDIIFDITGILAFNRLIDEYYISPLIPKSTETVIDVTDVRVLSNGDFNQHDLHESVKKQNVTQQALNESYQLLADRKCWKVFGAGIENCIQITEMLNAMGVAACCVHGKQSNETRDNHINGYKEGRFKAIVSNSILLVGFDHPPIDAIIDLRPTVSVVTHIQKYGRGTRPYYHPSFSFQQLLVKENRKLAMEMGGAPNCKVLDFAGNTMRLGPINDPILPKKKTKPGTGKIPIKICPECGAYNHTPARFCCDPDCNYEFVFKSKLKASASTAELIRRNDSHIEIWDVTNMNGYLFTKAGKPDKVRVSYFCGIQAATTWLGFGEGHHAFVKHKSHEWWRQHSAGEVPESVEEALERFSECRMTRQLKVDTSQKYPEITEFLF